jgi:hypothetical protein
VQNLFILFLFLINSLKGEHEHIGSNNIADVTLNHNIAKRDLINMGLSQKEVAEKLRRQWKKLWQERADDKLRAEGVATADYHDLFVEKGTIIHATRDLKALDFKEILQRHHVENVERLVHPDAHVGGWNKFIKVNITNKGSQTKNRAERCCDKKKGRQQPKKGGRGWLHAN